VRTTTSLEIQNIRLSKEHMTPKEKCFKHFLTSLNIWIFNYFLFKTIQENAKRMKVKVFERFNSIYTTITKNSEMQIVAGGTLVHASLLKISTRYHCKVLNQNSEYSYLTVTVDEYLTNLTCS
jgi:hypothetical protein